MRTLYFLGASTYFDFAVIHRMSVHREDEADFALIEKSQWWPSSIQSIPFNPDALGICNKVFYYDQRVGVSATDIRECRDIIVKYYSGLFSDAMVRLEEYERIYVLPERYNSVGAYLVLRGLSYYCLESGIHYYENIQNLIDNTVGEAYSALLTVLGVSDSSSQLATRVVTLQSTTDRKDVAYETWDYVSAVINMPDFDQKKICALFQMNDLFPVSARESLLYIAQNPPVTKDDDRWREKAEKYYQLIIGKFAGCPELLIILMPADAVFSNVEFGELFPNAIILPFHYRADLLLYIDRIGDSIVGYLTVSKYSQFWSGHKHCIWLSPNFNERWEVLAYFFDLDCLEYFDKYAPYCSRFFVHGFGIEWSGALKGVYNPRKIIWENLLRVDAYANVPMAQPYAPLVALIDSDCLQAPEQLLKIIDIVDNAHPMSEFYFVNTQDRVWNMPDSLYRVCGKDAVGFIPQFNLLMICRDAGILAERVSLTEFTLDMTSVWFAKFPKIAWTTHMRQMIMLHSLREFSALCSRAGVRWFLDYGNLLGAVRNGGFLPWDDDLDVSMMHEDFIKFYQFLNADNQNETHRMTLHSLEAPGMTEHIKYYTGSGCSVDIWVICRIKGPEYEGELMDIKKRYAKKKENAFGSMATKTRYVDEAFMSYHNAFVDEVTNLGKDVDTVSDYLASISYVNMRTIFPYNAVFPLNTISFEGYEFPAPNDIATVLNSGYKDFMKLPHYVHVHNVDENTEALIASAHVIQKKDPSFYDRHVRSLIEEMQSQ